jgi:lipopolysaccharide export system protein LptA
VAGAALAAALAPHALRAQAIDLSHGGPVTVTAAGGIDWNQAAQTVTAHDDARAVRGNVTVTADRLIAHYRKKAAPPGAKPDAAPKATPAVAASAAPNAAPTAASSAPGSPDDTGNNEIYRLDADGHVHIYTATDQAWGDHAVYDIDQAVLVMTGKAMRLTTPQDVMTARDTMEYWSQKHMAVGRGDARVTSNDGRRIAADTLVGYTIDNGAPAAGGAAAAAKPAAKPVAKTEQANDTLGAAGKLQRVEAFGHVQVRTPTEIVNGDRGVYVPDTGLARIVGHVHVTRGENVLNGAAAIVNMKTGIATMTEVPGARVQGLVVPNEQQPKGATAPGARPGAATPARKPDDVTAKDDK